MINLLYIVQVPFRLTRMLVKAMEVSGIEGTFRTTCENVMQVLRTNKDSVMAMMEVDIPVAFCIYFCWCSSKVLLFHMYWKLLLNCNSDSYQQIFVHCIVLGAPCS